MRQIAPTPSDPLSPRERDVLSLLTWGCTNQQVAEQLCVSAATARTYIRLAYRAIGVTSRTQAVVWGVRNGLAAPLAPGPRPGPVPQRG